MTDLDQERADKGVAYVHAEIDKLLAKGRINQGKANRHKALVPANRQAGGVGIADFVIEAVFEEMSVKQSVFADVEKVVCAECVLATNTSSLSITESPPTSSTQAGRGLPLLQPRRGDAAAGDRQGRRDRRRHAGHGVRHRPRR